ncbi:MAG: preprotein translocase subunit SecY [Candidatus Micrarchaeia archaeon]
MIIDILAAISKKLPGIAVATSPPPLKEKMMWTFAALIIFFAMYNIPLFGTEHVASFDFLQMITASRIGTLLTTGIGPIVMASIFLQLFVGAKIINLDLKNPSDKQKFHEAQKTLAIVIALIEAAMFVQFGVGGLRISDAWGMILPILVILQITFGSVALLYLDEIISKYGIGSGISIFIAAGVSFAIIGGLVGTIIFGNNGVVSALTEGGAEGIPLALLAFLPFIFTIIIFFGVAYAESVKVEIQIAHERIRGITPKLPLKLFYVSNIPVIFASALLMNMGAVGMFLDDVAKNPVTIPFTQIDISFILPYIQEAVWLIRPIWYQGTFTNFSIMVNNVTPYLGIPEWVHAITYILFLSLVSIVFGIFWAETSGLDAKSVANQLNSSNIQVPGYRRDPRLIETVLERHIFPLTVLGSFLVGLLAGIADLTGALGTGTGILLTVGILARMYEQLKQMKAFEMYPSIGKLMG